MKVAMTSSTSGTSHTIPVRSTTIQTGYTERFAKDYTRKFSDLNKSNQSIIAKIRQLVGILLSKIKSNAAASPSIHRLDTVHGQVTNWAVHMGAAHMASGVFAGNMRGVAVSETVSLLQQIAPNETKLIKALQFSQRVSELTSTHAGLEQAAMETRKAVSALQEGEFIAIPSDSPNHAMMIMIKCTRDTEGKKVYTVTQFNIGEGSNIHHHQKMRDGKPVTQSGLQIGNVSQECLCGEKSQFFSTVLSQYLSGTTTGVYEAIKTQLDGQVLEESPDPRLWRHEQIGGSCTVDCILSLIRSELTPTSYKAFRELTRTEILLRSFESIKSGRGNNMAQKVATLEIVNRLERSLQKRGMQLTKELKDLKSQLQKMTSGGKSPQERLSSRGLLHSSSQGMIQATLNNVPIELQFQGDSPSAETAADNINIAFSFLKEGNFSKESLDQAQPFIHKVLSMGRETWKNMSPNEIEKFEQIICQMISHYGQNEQPHTQEQMFVIAAFSSCLHNFLLASTGSNMRNQIASFVGTAQSNYARLQLNLYFKNPHFDPQISLIQRYIFSPDRIKTPDALVKMKNEMQQRADMTRGPQIPSTDANVTGTSEASQPETAGGIFNKTTAYELSHDEAKVMLMGTAPGTILFRKPTPPEPSSCFVLERSTGNNKVTTTFYGPFIDGSGMIYRQLDPEKNFDLMEGGGRAFKTSQEILTYELEQAKSRRAIAERFAKQ